MTCFSLFQLDRTALQWAAANGHLQIIQILIESGAGIEAQDKVINEGGKEKKREPSAINGLTISSTGLFKLSILL